MTMSFLTDAFCVGALQAALDCMIKGSLLVLAAWVLTMALRNRSAHLRSHIWTFTLTGLLAIPVLALVMPVWSLPVLPELADLGEFLRALAGGGREAAATDMEFLTVAFPDTEGTDFGTGPAAGFGDHWSSWVLLALLAGGLATAAWVGLSRFALQRIVRRARPLDESWHPLLETLSEELRLRRPVRLLKASAIRAGITVGTLRPVVILPADADEWPLQRRRLTVSHELAHVKRRDALVEDLSIVVLVLYWFNPLVWLALRHQRIEREMDCDNRVLNTGAKPSDYAMQLMQIAQDFSGEGIPWRMAGLAENTNLRDRLLHILNPRAARNSSRGGVVIVAGLMLLALALPLAAVNPWHEARAADDYTSVELTGKAGQYWQKIEKPKRDLSAAYRAEQMLTAGDCDGAVAMLCGLLGQKSDERRYYVEEKQLNGLGYRLLNEKRVDDAIAIFRTNVKAFPKAWNTHDSLAEAYLYRGDLEKARKHYENSLKLGSENEEKAAQALKYIEKLKLNPKLKQKKLASW